jgi:branched-chain amino acid transport system substrate-binding protein
MRKTLSLLALVAGILAAPAARADITIGFVTSLSGPGSSALSRR